MKEGLSYNIKALKKDFKKLATDIELSAEQAVQKVVTQHTAFFMSFDETEAIPFVDKKKGAMVFSGNIEKDAGMSVEDFIQLKTKEITENTKEALQRSIMEVLK